MPSFTDQLGRTIFLSGPPRRIISLVPSQTELLFSLGLDDTVVGITRFCARPSAWFQGKLHIGGTRAVDPIRVDALQPDLIIANKEENDKPQIDALAARYPVWVSDVKTLPDALDMIWSIGELTGRAATAQHIALEISGAFSVLIVEHQTAPRPKVIYLMWHRPYMAAGGDTFIHHMLEAAGFENLLGHETRYPVIDLADYAGSDGGAGLTILLSSEPFPFRQRHIDEINKALPHARVILVDGQLFSWYGSRLLEAPSYFRALGSLLLK
jgi:ABC-type Fe3+-hydroxamate transport system substrate-binding protein